MSMLRGVLERTPADRLRYVLIALVAGLTMLLLSACGELSSTTEVDADGSGTQTFTVRIDSSDMEKIDGGAGAIKKIVEDKNPGGFTWEDSTKDGDDVTTIKVSLAFDSPEDYQSKAAAALEASGITETPEVVFQEPTPPFSTGYTFARSFSDEEMIRWVSQALLDEGRIENEDDPSNLVRGDSTDVTVDGEELSTTTLESDPSANAWSNAEALSFTAVDIVTTGFHDPGADQFQRTITYTLERETYRKASEDFDAFFEAAVPDGGELKPAADSENTWTVTFPVGTAEQVAGWTDTALADTGAQLSVSEASQGENPLKFTTNIVSDVSCSIACPEGSVTQQVAMGEDPSQLEQIPVSAEPYQAARMIMLTGAEMDIEVDREGGGSLEARYSLTEQDDETVSEESMTSLLGGDVEREASDGTVTYTVDIEGGDGAEFGGALEAAGFGVSGTNGLTVAQNPETAKEYYVGLYLQHPEALSGHLPESVSWTVSGDGLKPTSILYDGTDTAALDEDGDITATSGGGDFTLEFLAERTGLTAFGIIAIIVGVGILALLIAAGVLAYVFRSKLKGIFSGSSGAEEPTSADEAQGQTVQDQPTEGQPTEHQAAPWAAAPAGTEAAPGETGAASGETEAASAETEAAPAEADAEAPTGSEPQAAAGEEPPTETIDETPTQSLPTDGEDPRQG